MKCQLSNCREECVAIGTDRTAEAIRSESCDNPGVTGTVSHPLILAPLCYFHWKQAIGLLEIDPSNVVNAPQVRKEMDHIMKIYLLKKAA